MPKKAAATAPHLYLIVAPLCTATDKQYFFHG